jgi:hypothetical protein
MVQCVQAHGGKHFQLCIRRPNQLASVEIGDRFWQNFDA